MKKIILKEKNIISFCFKKGWDASNLTVEQMLIISRNVK